MSFAGLVRAIHPVGIELTGTNPFNPDVPHITRAVACGIEINHPGGHCVCGLIEQLEPNAAGVTAEQGKVDPSLGFMGSQRQRDAPPHFSVFGDFDDVIRSGRSGVFVPAARTSGLTVSWPVGSDDIGPFGGRIPLGVVAFCIGSGPFMLLPFEMDHRCHRIGRLPEEPPRRRSAV